MSHGKSDPKDKKVCNLKGEKIVIRDGSSFSNLRFIIDEGWKCLTLPAYKKSMVKPSLSKKAFWDISFDELDFEKSSLYVMEKVFNYGTWNDQVAVMKYYGLARIRKEIVQAAYLRQPVLSFLCTILQLQKTDFSCYNKMQLNPLPWNY